MEQKYLDNISRRIVYFRKLKNLSQADLATRAGIPQRTYQRIEYNDTLLNMMQLFKIASVLEVDPSEIIYPQDQQIEEFHYSDRDYKIGIFDFLPMEQLIDDLEHCFKNIDQDLHKTDFAFTEESTSKVYFSPKFSGKAEGMEVEFGDITQNKMSLVKYWEQIIKMAHVTKYHIGYVQTFVEEEEKAFISLAMATSTKPYEPKSKSINYFVPLDVKISIEDILKISKELSSRVGIFIHCHGHIG